MPPELRLVSAADSPSSVRLDVDQLVRRSPARPADRLQECWVAGGASLRELARSAERGGLDLVTAFALCAERQLIARELGDRADVLLGRLDALAASPRASGELASASAKYLRMLAGRGQGGPRPTLSAQVRLALPVRLLERIHWAELLSEEGVRADALESAVAWEVAAILEGRTMTEWALGHALVLTARS